MKQDTAILFHNYTNKLYLTGTVAKFCSISGRLAPIRKWTYLYRAADTAGHTIDFYLSRRRNTNSAMIFLAKAIKGEKLQDRHMY